MVKLEGIPDNVRADIMALFTDVEEREKTIGELRKKNEDADVIVKRAPELEKLTNEQKTQIDLLNGKLAEYTGKKVETDAFDPLEAFRPFTSFLG